jgi:hypothetical protein
LTGFSAEFLLGTVDNLADETLKCGDRLVKYLFRDIAVLYVDRRHLGLAKDWERHARYFDPRNVG